MTSARDVVITGRGAVTAAGIGVAPLLEAVSTGRCLLASPLVIGDPLLLDGPVGEVSMEPDGLRPQLRIVEMAVTAAQQALAEAALSTDELSNLDVILGTGSGTRSAEDWRLAGRQPPTVTAAEGGERFALVTDLIRAELGARGRSITINTACSSGGNAIAHAWELLLTGRAHHILCIGVEELWAGLFLSFKMIGALSHEPCKPFGRSSGTTLAEGAAALLLELRDTALHRGAMPLGVVLGIGQSADAFHMTHPDPDGVGARLSVDRALRAAGITTSSVDVVATHGTGTAANDEMERWLQTRLFPLTPMIATKATHGHTHGASAAVELLALLECLRSPSYRPHSTLLTRADGATPTTNDWRVGVKNAFAIGGLNTSIVAAGPGYAARRSYRRSRRAVFSVAELAVAGSSWLPSEGPTFDDSGTRDGEALIEVPPLHEKAHDLKSTLSKRDWRRMDLLGKMVLTAAALIVRPVSISANFDEVGLAFATHHGPALAWAIASDTLRRGARLRPETISRLSYNAAPSWVCQIFSFRGPTVAYTSGDVGAFHAFEHAVMVLELGLADIMLVIGADEYTGPCCPDDGLTRLSGMDPTGSLFASVHTEAANPQATPAVAACLLVREDRLALCPAPPSWPVQVNSETFVLPTLTSSRLERLPFQSASPLFEIAERIGKARATTPST
ncbi:MAG: hypothetical protein M3Q30_03615 [Actinomycetota bacterium]|nr:hypothetical protein [Actinomycetota bacterium]